MRKIIFLALISASFIQAESILIKSGTILDGSGENPFKADILIDGARIIEISSGINESKADRLIDASDKIVTPGLISPISNIGVVEINALDVTTDDESSIYGPGFSIFYAFNPNSTLIPWNKSNGVTSAISTPGYSNEIFKDRILESGFKKAFKGSWGAEEHTHRPEVIQDLNRLSYNSYLSHLRKLNLPLELNLNILLKPKISNIYKDV